jgi:phosphatidylserine/phosphatidylglycerophosphate/cardiolipin synthase-like enzyme
MTDYRFAPFLCEALANANTEVLALIYTASQTKRFDSKLRVTVKEMLHKTARRGLECRAVIATHHYRSAYEFGNTIAAKDLTVSGWKIRRAPVKPVMHSKLFIIDRRLVAVGSHNITDAAHVSNYECTAVLYDATAVKTAMAYFEHVFSKAL